MKPQQDTKRKKKKDEIMLRARVDKHLKHRVKEYGDKIERSESYVVRAAVLALLPKEEQPA